MDRRERYDPEDIESLMHERSFDELLEEERTYVLRHLSDREEYEAMRSLLLHMRQEPEDPAPIGADPAVREHVLEVFRREQQPRWRIWLNSVGASLLPAEAKAMWRPALAFATVALLVVVGAVVLRQNNEMPPRLAEVKPAPAPAPNTLPPAATTEKDAPVEPAVSGSTAEPVATQLQDQVFESALAKAEQQGAARTAQATEDRATANEPVMLEQERFAEVRESNVEDERKEKRDADAETIATDAVTLSHVVTSEELTRNASTANATGKVSATRQRTDTGLEAPARNSKSMAQETALLDLIAAGW